MKLDPRLEQLLAAYLDGADVTEAELAELEGWLLGDPEAMEGFLSQIDVAIGLDECLGHADDKVVESAPESHSPKVVVASWWQAAWKPLAAAAAVVAVGLVTWWMTGTKPTADLPQVAGKTIQVGEVIAVPETEDFELVYADGTKVTLRGGAQFAVAKPAKGKQLELTAGALVAAVAKQPAGQPMMLKTPQGEFTVVGTKFFLMVADVSRRSTDAKAEDAKQPFTRLDVTEGLVRAAANGQEFDVAAGQAICIGEGIESKVMSSDGREFSPKYGGVFYQQAIDAYDRGTWLADAWRKDLMAQRTKVPASEVISRMAGSGKNNNCGVSFSLKKQSVQLTNPHEKPAEVLIPLSVGIDLGNVSVGYRFRVVDVMGQLGKFEVSLVGKVEKDFTPVARPSGLVIPDAQAASNRKVPLNKWINLTETAVRVGWTSHGEPIYELTKHVDGSVFAAGWKHLEGELAQHAILSQVTVDIDSFSEATRVRKTAGTTSLSPSLSSSNTTTENIP